MGWREHSQKPVPRWNRALMQSPRQLSQSDDGSGGQMFCGELNGPASSAAGRMKSMTASSPVKQRRHLSFSYRCIPTSWAAFRKSCQSRCTLSLPEWVFGRSNIGYWISQHTIATSKHVWKERLSPTELTTVLMQSQLLTVICAAGGQSAAPSGAKTITCRW